MLRGVFVTGTDTGVGKTVVAAALLLRLRHLASPVPPPSPLCPRSVRDRIHKGVRYWKPIQTGIEQDDDTGTVRRLAGCGRDEIVDEGIRLPRPVSPHLAAQLSGATIALASLTAIAASQPADRAWVIEGAGGILVPLNDRDLMVDLMAELALPLVIVARSGLGTINHTLLTLEAIRARNLSLVGVVMNGEPNGANRRAIEHYGGVPILGELPRLEPLSPVTLAAWVQTGLDPGGRLRESLP